ncbi:flagellin lysine-N-methylase [Azohydromonas aeria]|uniref:flagellin lysine-N-methylase n=1 Tax=Azohydromonas aeria TaxID=2590212 RepID=UPI0012F9F829|nr:flagellin lysine-N-methylase [Azohydromonas aeria]
MSELHPERTIQALRPRYVSRFSCIGAECEDSCCKDWVITVDRTTLDAWQQLEDAGLRHRLAAHLQQRTAPAGEASPASIRLHPDTQACPLLENHLCCVQKSLGATYLSNTCHAYPRVSRLFAGQHEQALTLSCPEAARQALLAADAFEFVEEPATLRTEVLEQPGARHGLPVELMSEIRIYCIQLMQTQGLELWQKLAVLGGFCEALSCSLAQGGQADVPALLKSYVLIVENGLVGEALGQLQPDHAVQARTSWLLWQNTVQDRVPAAQRASFHFVLQGLGAGQATADIGPQQLIEHYGRGIGRLDQAMAAAAPGLLQHYVLNELFRELFPFNGASPYQHYLVLIFRFTLLRLVLAARCNAGEELPDGKALARAVQLFCRHFQHDGIFTQQMGQVLANHGWNRLENVYRLLRA